MRYSDFATGWTVRRSNPGGSVIFRSRLDRPCGPTYHPVQYVAGLFTGVQRPGRGVDHPPHPSTKVKERVQLYLYSPLRGVHGLS